MASNGGMVRVRGSAPVGLVSFLVGIAMILFAFYLAFQIFQVPPSIRMDAVPGKPVDIGNATESLVAVFVKIIVLVAMAGFGSMVANRGVKLYASNSDRTKKPQPGRAKNGPATDESDSS